MSDRLETMFYAEGTGVNERKPNFRDGSDRFYLVRCYVCPSVERVGIRTLHRALVGCLAIRRQRLDSNQHLPLAHPAVERPPR